VQKRVFTKEQLMLAHAISAYARLDSVEEVILSCRNSILAASPGQDAYVALFLLVDRRTGRVMMIQVWDSEAIPDTFAADKRWLALFSEMMPLLASRPLAEGFEVAVCE
jgi:hypothetical protein